jgi:hypothetical protein
MYLAEVVQTIIGIYIHMLGMITSIHIRMLMLLGVWIWIVRLCISSRGFNFSCVSSFK